MFVALLDLQLDLLVKVEDIAWFCYCFLKDPVEIESTPLPGASFMQSLCGFVRQSSVLKIFLPMEAGNKEDCSLDMAPRRSISIVIWILSSDTICQLNQFNTNSEAAMLCTAVGSRLLQNIALGLLHLIFP